MTQVNSRGAGLIVLECIFTLIILLAVAARYWSIKVQRRSIMASDWLVLVALVAATAFNCTVFWACANNLGATSTEMTPTQLQVQAKTLFAVTFTWTTATVFCKLSVLMLYMQIFDCKSTFRWACITLICLCIAYEIAFIPVFVTECDPPQAGWTGEGTCRTETTEELASVGGNLVLDTAVVVLPIPYIWSLHMPWRRKLEVSSVFGIGFAIVAIICWRLAYTVQIESGSIDQIYGTYLVAIQCTLEVSLGILAACMPTLKPLGPVIKRSSFGSYLMSLRYHSSGGTSKDDCSIKKDSADERVYTTRSNTRSNPPNRSWLRKFNLSASMTSTSYADIDSELTVLPQSMNVAASSEHETTSSNLEDDTLARAQTHTFGQKEDPTN